MSDDFATGRFANRPLDYDVYQMHVWIERVTHRLLALQNSTYGLGKSHPVQAAIYLGVTLVMDEQFMLTVRVQAACNRDHERILFQRLGAYAVFRDNHGPVHTSRQR